MDGRGARYRDGCRAGSTRTVEREKDYDDDVGHGEERTTDTFRGRRQYHAVPEFSPSIMRGCGGGGNFPITRDLRAITCRLSLGPHPFSRRSPFRLVRNCWHTQYNDDK